MLNFNPAGKKVILSVDGGGMRGTISIAMLAELEAMTGKPCQQLFDMVAGTSTGAIIAAALGLGFTAQQTLDLVYLDRLPKAFPSGGLGMYLRYLLNGLRYLYPLEPFRVALQPLSQGKCIRDMTHPIVFMTAKDVRVGDVYYIVSKGPGLKEFADWPLAGAVAASGAAPIYFPPVANNLIDGGVGTDSNPCLAATIEALEYIGKEDPASGFVPGNIIHVSLGTGYIPTTRQDADASRFRLWDWLPYVIFEQLDDANLQQVYATRTIYGDQIDFRRYNPELTRASVGDKLGIAMDGKPDPSTFGLDTVAPDALKLMEAIGRAYAHKLDWTLSGQMPWNTIGGHPQPRLTKASVDWSKTPYGL
jgi:uncharacterized protein